jgi:hypothetical protein
MTDSQAAALSVIEAAHAGFVSIKGYRVTTGYVAGKPKVVNVTLNGKPSYETVKARRLEALQSITLGDLDLSDWVPNKGKEACATAAEQFAQVYAEEVAKAAGETRGSESHAQAHDDHSISVNGAKVWLHDADADGVRAVKSINLFALPVSETVIDRGEWKPVNSGSKVLMRNAIHAVWNKRSCAIKTYTLGEEGKYDEVRIDGAVIG